jgi:hypothetical protein
LRISNEPNLILSPIGDVLQGVLELQPAFSPTPSDAMTDRRKLVQNDLVATIGVYLNTSSDTKIFQVKGSNGAGNNARIPWCRIYEPTHSPSAQSGWYVVFLFSTDGSTVSLSLNQGVTDVKNQFGAGYREEIEKRASRARSLLLKVFIDEELPTGLEQKIELGGSGLGEDYEVGNVFSFVYKKSLIPSDEIITRDISRLLAYLGVLMEKSNELEPNQPVQPSVIETELTGPYKWLCEQTSWTPMFADQIVSGLLDGSPQIILTGPPGTGKTYGAKKVAEHILRTQGIEDTESNIRIVQFHPSYGYEEFVEGLRPESTENGFRFAPQFGIVIQMALGVLEDGKPRVLIIDEINRANIPRVFGELMYLLEYRDSKIDLMYHAEQFSLPPNLYIIGTMNTADRSVQGIDLALRRRFDFFELKPDVEVLRNWYKDKENKLGEGLFQGFIALNKHLEDHVGKHLAIGQSYLMRPLMDSKTLDKIWDQQLMPLIEEYFFDRPNHLSDFSRENYWP